MRWNKEGEDKLRGAYGNGSTSTLRRARKAALEFEKQASKTYNIKELWQRNIDLGRIPAANSQVGLEQVPESQPSNSVFSPSPLSGVSRGGTSLMSSQETLKNQRIEALKDLSKLLRLVTEQEKKYETRLSLHSNFYRRHIMVQQFLHSQLSSQPSQRRRNISRNVARSFGRRGPTARNIVRWEKEWVASRNIPESKGREDSNSWMYDGDLNDAMREFVRTQGDRKYCLG